jgi:hypothetical protein
MTLPLGATMHVRRTPGSSGEVDRRLREVAQLRKLWRAFRELQERLADERLARAIVGEPPPFPRVQEPLATYAQPVVRAAIRYWWCRGEYAAIVELAARLDPALFDEEPLIRVYFDAAKEHLARPNTQQALRSYPCTAWFQPFLPHPFRETVEVARRAHTEEAKVFEALIRSGRLHRRSPARSARTERLLGLSQALGPEERGILRLFFREKADVIITGDRAFLNVLVRNRVPFMTPASLLIDLARAGKIAREEAQAAAKRLRPYIRWEVY